MVGRFWKWRHRWCYQCPGEDLFWNPFISLTVANYTCWIFGSICSRLPDIQKPSGWVGGQFDSDWYTGIHGRLCRRLAGTKRTVRRWTCSLWKVSWTAFHINWRSPSHPQTALVWSTPTWNNTHLIHTNPKQHSSGPHQHQTALEYIPWSETSLSYLFKGIISVLTMEFNSAPCWASFLRDTQMLVIPQSLVCRSCV